MLASATNAVTTVQGRRTWTWAIPALVLLFFIVGQLLVLLPAKYLQLISKETVETYPTILYLIIGSFAAVAVLFVTYIRYFERRNLASCGLVFGPGWMSQYASGYALGLAMAAAIVVTIVMTGAYVIVDPSAARTTDWLPIAILLLAFVIQASTEEFVFRGWMMNRLTERFGLWVGILGNSLLFTLMHVEIGTGESTPIVMVLLFTVMTLLFSIFLSLLVIRQGSVLGACAWHASWNWMFITWFGLPTTGIELGLSPLLVDLEIADDAAAWLTGGSEGPEGSVITVAVLLIACVLLTVKHERVTHSQSAQ